MKPNLTPRDMARISIQDIVNYLTSNGWKENSTKNDRIRQFLGPNSDTGKPLTISVPASEKVSDYYERVLDLLFALSTVRKNTVESILEQISLVASDVLRMRVFSSLGDSQSLPLDVAALEVEGLRDLYMWGACSEQKSAPYFEKPTALSEHHVRNCRFGHTFEGSFGFVVTSPIIEKFDQLNLFTERLESPFERRVTERIARGFFLIGQSIEKNDPSILVDNFTVGLNSRMCDAILKMSIEKQNELTFLIDWSYQLAPPPDIGTQAEVRFSEPEFELVEYASNEMRKIEPFKDFIIGKIVTLHSISDPRTEGALPRTAIIKHIYEDRFIDVKLELNRDQYLVAYDAHGKGQRVKVQGNLYRKGTVWRMADTDSIEVF